MNQTTRAEILERFNYHGDGYLIRRSTNRRAGWVRSYPTPYRCVQLHGKLFYEHRLIFCLHYGTWPKSVDHVNRNPLDNRIENLRAASYSQNQANRNAMRNSKSGVKGVYPLQNGKWGSQISWRKKRYVIGVFDSIESAKQAYDQKAKQLHREFAVK